MVNDNKSKMCNIPVRLRWKSNPFLSKIRGCSAAGKVVGIYKGEKIGENLSAGVYFVVPQNKNISPLRIVKVR